jgi:histidinol-phosphate aminotransferase
VRVDLSTCVSRYGPPPTALAALRSVPEATLREHPYGADEALVGAYAAHLGVPPDQLVAGRGASGLIWRLAASSLAPRVAVPLPAYTEYRQAFPASAAGPRGLHHRLDVVAELLRRGRVVLLANPHNPSGRAFTAAELREVAAEGERAGGVLVVDESYVEFTADLSRWTLVARAAGGPSDNVVVLRSPSKFYGLAGARVAVAWSTSPDLRRALCSGGGSWPVSALEVAPVAVALADRAWARATHDATCDDAAWLAGALAPLGPVAGGSVTHFQLVVRPDAPEVAGALADAGIGVRVLGTGHGLPGPSLRIAAPRADERDEVGEALHTVAVRLTGRALGEDGSRRVTG